ncbi:hypothetical protein DRO69_09130 [Candidatus Bathyarchaeota archaeon]|nr:MAG: hypothetical protein DRO69_09130 [Candidatus Bathyarchaeota archaeon]
MNEIKAEISPLKAKSLDEYFRAIGYELDVQTLKENMKKLTIETVYGLIDLITYDGLVQAKIFEYLKFGTARRVWQMMKKQEPQITEDDIKQILLEMARMEIEYGLRPITHTIPVAGQVYVKADGYLFYAKKSGKLKNIRWNDKQEDDGSWTANCIVETTDGGTYEGIATIKPTNNRMDDPREKARTKAMRRALRRAFPIGASDEIYDEFENQPVYTDLEIEEPVSDLKDLVEEPNKEEDGNLTLFPEE